MALSTGQSSGISAEINVTPLIDVLLVLLIIFMVIVPVMPRGLPALLPQPPRNLPPITAQEQPVIVTVHAGLESGVLYTLGDRPMQKQALREELTRLLANRTDKAMFVRGSRDLDFSAVAELIALGREANADRVGILTASDGFARR